MKIHNNWHTLASRVGCLRGSSCPQYNLGGAVLDNNLLEKASITLAM
jgi:hypothetical protein